MRDNLLDPCHRHFGIATGKHWLEEGGVATCLFCYEFLDYKSVKDMHNEIKKLDFGDSYMIQ